MPKNRLQFFCFLFYSVDVSIRSANTLAIVCFYLFEGSPLTQRFPQVLNLTLIVAFSLKQKVVWPHNLKTRLLTHARTHFLSVLTLLLRVGDFDIINNSFGVG